MVLGFILELVIGVIICLAGFKVSKKVKTSNTGYFIGYFTGLFVLFVLMSINFNF